MNVDNINDNQITYKLHYKEISKDHIVLDYIENISGYFLYLVTATYGANDVKYYVRAFNKKQARKRFERCFTRLKIKKIEKTDEKEESLNVFQNIVI